jgi:hypothetical protein
MGIYNAEISAGSLLLLESRRIAELLMMRPSPEQWLHALNVDNILQKSSPATARRQARLIRHRLDTLDNEAWAMIVGGPHEAATQLLLAAAVKHSRLLADFLVDVYGGHLRRLESQLTPAKDWESFLADCVKRDPEFAQLSDSTQAKLLQVILRILAEARYIDSTRNLRLTPPHLHPNVLAYLKRHGDHAVLSVMDQTR